jgi:hypothetical protein
VRGFKRDTPATKAAHFADKRSFVSLPKVITGDCDEPKPHLILYGVDKAPIRAEIFRRNREANGGVNRCWKCNRPVAEYPRDVTDEIYDSTPRGEWDHRRNKAGQRCDCVSNGRVACHKCHSERHPQTQFGRPEIPTNNP